MTTLSYSNQCQRAGNTLVVALGVLTVVVAVISLSSVGATSTLREALDSSDRLRALAAVEAVLARHERTLLDRAESGILADYGTKDTPLAVDNNYGLDMVGNCSVRWKIEPCRTQDQGGTIGYMINPPPTGVVDTPASPRQVNDLNFMFRISAEASVRPNPNELPTAVAQGARYALAVNEPLFRYVIFYAQSGANGDLEFSHDPAVTIAGDIHSNGAIYIGSGTWVNHWGAAAGPSGATNLGPDSQTIPAPIRITGVNGIFCLSKPLMFGALNNYPMAGTAPSWFGSWAWSNVYDPLGAPTPAVGLTQIINPQGVKDAAGFNTNLAGTSGAVRQINGINIYSGITGGNDARDSERASGYKWNPYSLTWFANKARTLETGGRKIPLSLGSKVRADSRPFDPVQLIKIPSALNPNTDAPELSTPILSGTSEAAGYYLSQVITGTSVRNAGGTGWTVTPSVPAAAIVGLAIRERPIPDTLYWPGFTGSTANALAPMAPSDPNFMPYAYGKHWYPTVMPFYPTWVTQGTGSSDWRFGGNNNSAWSAGINTASQMTSQIYFGGGKFLMSSACNPGDSGTSNNDTLEYYNNNWQFTHLRKPQKTAVAGINASLFIEDTTFSGSNLSGTSRHRLQGAPASSLAVSGGMNWASLAAMTTSFAPANPVQNFSMRCEGFVVPQYSEAYTFTATVTNGVRIWIDGRVVYDNWGSGPTTTPISLIANQSYPLVVEMFDDSTTSVLQVKWNSASTPLAIIPTTALFTRTNQAFTKANWTSLVARIDPAVLSGPTTLKAGIMVRPGAGGLSPLLSGRESYLMLGYSPTRGIFTERRLQPSMVTQRLSNSWYTGIGATSQGAPVPSTGIMTIVNPHTGTWPVDGVSTSFVVTRAATITPSYTQGLPAPNITTDGPNYVSTTTNSEGSNSAVVSIDGRPVTVTYGYTGDGVWSETGYYRTRSVGNIRQVTRFTNSDGNATFNATHSGKRVRLYGPAANTTTSTYSAPGQTIATIGGNYFELQTTLYQTFSAYNVSPTVSSPSKNFNPKWVYTEDDTTSGHDLTYIVARLNALSWNGGGWIVAPTSMSGPGNPANPGVPVPAAPAYATLGQPYGVLAYTFGIDLGSLVADISLNSYVTSKGVWFAPATATWPATPVLTNVAKNIPWPASWTTAGLTHPATGSYAPNMWVNTGYPANPAVSSSSTQTVVGSRYTDDQPLTLPTAASSAEIWLMLNKTVVGGRDLVSFSYSIGLTPPASAGAYSPVLDYTGAALTADITGWGTSLLMGPCLQSGNIGSQATALFTDLKVTSSDVGNIGGVFDFNVWDQLMPGVTRNPMSSYLASQYQVFWGDRDITEDFFSFQESVPNGRTATEEGYVNPREFWSQSRWWDDGSEKDMLPGAPSTYNALNTGNRQLWARSTFLTLNLQQVQKYLMTSTRLQATTFKPITVAGSTRAGATGAVLTAEFNGLIYAARTNRYPWNPTPGSLNPFSCNAASDLPNGMSNTGAATMLTSSSMSDTSMFHGSVHKLQPYAVNATGIPSEAPPFKPQHFHHGVRLINGAAITWGVSTGSTFGSGKTTIITPNQLFIQGDLNTTKTSVVVPGVAGQTLKNTPLAVVGDQITYLSNAFCVSATNKLDTSRLQGFVPYTTWLNGSNYLPPMILAPVSVGQASSTSYVAAMITNNQPTTCERVREGQGAPFIDTMQYLEKWGNGVAMNYTGSLVVIDSRRYTDSFLLDGPRTDGRSPFGIMGWNATSAWGNATPAQTWNGTVPIVYSSPDRTLSFNRDLLTEEGTPPFTPIGVTSTGLGGWTRIVK